MTTTTTNKARTTGDPISVEAPTTVVPRHNNAEEEWLFSCRCESTKSVSTLLSCLRNVSRGDTNESKGSSGSNSRLIQPVTIFCSPTGLNFHVHASNTSQASVDLQAGLFSDYKLFDSEGEFCVNLSTVLECLHVLGTHSLDKTKLTLSYNVQAEILKLELLEDVSGVLSTAAIPAMSLPAESSSSMAALAFRSSPIVARIICKSSWLKDALVELSLVPGATSVSIVLSPQGLEWAAVGYLGECLVSTQSSSVIVSLDCTVAQARTYPLHAFQNGMRGLEFAEETCMSMNEAGMIAVQHQILDHVGTGAPNFVDFIMSCLVDDDDEDTTTTSRGTQEDRERMVAKSQAASESVVTSQRRPDSSSWDAASSQVSTSSVGIRGAATAGSVSVVSNVNVDDDEDDDEEEDLPPRIKTPLFGSLTTIPAAQRSRRRRRAINDDDDSDTSQPLLDKEVEESQPILDVTARATSPPRRRRHIRNDEEDGSSSPELVYK